MRPNSRQGAREGAGPRGLTEQAEPLEVCPGSQTKLDGIVSPHLPLLTSCTLRSWVYVKLVEPDGSACGHTAGACPVCEDGHAVLALPSQTRPGEPCAAPVHRSALLGGTGPPGAAERGVSVRVTATCCRLCQAAGLTPRDRPSRVPPRAPAPTAAPGHCPAHPRRQMRTRGRPPAPPRAPRCPCLG